MKDRSFVGFKYARYAPQQRMMTAAAMKRGFAISAGCAGAQVKSNWVAPQDVLLVGLNPHMHVRGRDFKFTALLRDGREQILLNAPKFEVPFACEWNRSRQTRAPRGAWRPGFRCQSTSQAGRSASSRRPMPLAASPRA